MELQILVIEDNPQDQEIYQRYLEKNLMQNFKCSAVTSGEDGLDLIQAKDFDCVLLDYKLPDLDGLEFLDELAKLEKNNTCPIIILTGQGDETIAVEAMKNGASDYLVKGKLTDELLSRTILNAIEKKSAEKELQKYYQLLESRVKERTVELEEANANLRELLKREKELVETAEAASLAKSHFLSNISHELLTPMNAIIGMNMLLLNTELTDKQDNYAKKAQKRAYDLLVLINNVLDFSELEAGKVNLKIVNFRLDDIFKEIVKFISDKKVQIGFNIESNVPNALVGDMERLTRVFHILIENAIKFSKNQSTINIGCKVNEMDKTNATLTFFVNDQGIGISQKNIDWILNETLVQADASNSRNYEGLGLGLSIAKRLIGLMKGRIWIESEVGKGSTVYFTAEFQRQPKEIDFDITIFQDTECMRERPLKTDELLSHLLEGVNESDPVEIRKILQQLKQTEILHDHLTAIENNINDYEYEKAAEIIHQMQEKEMEKNK